MRFECTTEPEENDNFRNDAMDNLWFWMVKFDEERQQVQASVRSRKIAPVTKKIKAVIMAETIQGKFRVS